MRLNPLGVGPVPDAATADPRGGNLVSLWLYWLLPLLWTVLVMVLSGPTFSGDQTGTFLSRVLGLLCPALLHRLGPIGNAQVNFAARKLAHVAEYAVLALLWARASARGTQKGVFPAVAWALLVTTVVAFADEAHQVACPGRNGALADVLLDSAGAIIGGVTFGILERRQAPCRT